MTATSAFLGHQSLLGAVTETTYGTTPTPGTIAALNEAYVFVAERIQKRGVIVERAGLRGTRSHGGDDARIGPYTVGGPLVLEPSPTEFAAWLPRILGGAPSSGTYPLAETIPSFTLGVSRPPKKFRYPGCKVKRATLSGSPGSLLRLTLDLVGQSENLETTSWPAITADVTGPYIFSDLTLTIGGVAREVSDFMLMIDNGLVTDRFMNSTTIVNAPEGDRTIALRTTHAWAAANIDLYDAGLAGFTGATLSFTSGAHTTAFTFGLLQAAAESPMATNRQENFLSIDWNVRKTGSTSELIATHD